MKVVVLRNNNIYEQKEFDTNYEAVSYAKKLVKFILSILGSEGKIEEQTSTCTRIRFNNNIYEVLILE